MMDIDYCGVKVFSILGETVTKKHTLCFKVYLYVVYMQSMCCYVEYTRVGYLEDVSSDR